MMPASPTNYAFRGLIVLAILLGAAEAGSGEGRTDADAGIAPLFADTSTLAVTIKAPLKTLMDERPDEEYLSGTFSFVANDGAESVFDLKIRTRGNYRRQKEHCNFAPVRLNFRTSQLAGTEFTGQDKLKLVTHCQNRKPRFEQLVLREFLAYRLLNVITSRSYGVRLLKIRYEDTEDTHNMTKFGFVIEDDDDVAARNGLQVVRKGDISVDHLDREQQNLINVFQYLIGNTEYSLSAAEPDKDCCHNTDLMSETGAPPYIPLPYDFDFAGIVNAPYAQPNPRYKLRDVRQRLYKGLCENNELLPDTFQRFIEKRDAIYTVVEDLEALNSRSRRSVTRYLNSFYDQILEPETVEEKFIEACNERP